MIQTFLIHEAEYILNALFSKGQLTEDSQRDGNKDFRKYKKVIGEKWIEWRATLTLW